MLSLLVIRSQNIDKLAKFYAALGLHFTKHRHGQGPVHLSADLGETVFEIYPSVSAEDTTASTRLGFSVPSLSDVLTDLRGMDAPVLVEPGDSPYGRRAVVKDFDGHKVELYEKAC